MARNRTGCATRLIGRALLASLLILAAAILVAAGSELAAPGVARGKLYTAYFVAKGASWDREYPSGMPDTRAVDRVVTSLLAPEVARLPAKAWASGKPEPFAGFDALPAGTALPLAGQSLLSPPGAEWKVQAGEAAQGADWRAPGFDDAGWGAVQLPAAFAGAQALNRLPESPANAYYLRRAFTVEDPSIYRLMDLELRGSGAVTVYLNDVEIFNGSLLAEGTGVSTMQPARDPAAPAYFHQTVEAAPLRSGRNILAVELLPGAPEGADGSFDLILRGAALPASMRFAIIGDFGAGGKEARAVASLVKSWDPDIIITTGDNNYPAGKGKTIDKNVGQFYHDYIAPYYGRYGPGADQNRFFPTMGNHEWSDNNYVPSPPNAYLNYFTLPPGQGDERYYDFQWGPVHFFALDSDINEPDGITSDSVQAQWLRDRLQESQAAWKLVYMHHPPFASSDIHPAIEEINWPFAQWGASLVVSGHNHFYERLEHDRIPYFINGTGGGELYEAGRPAEGSQALYMGGYGAMLVQASPCSMDIWFITVENAVIDTYQLASGSPACQAEDPQRVGSEGR